MKTISVWDKWNFFSESKPTYFFYAVQFNLKILPSLPAFVFYLGKYEKTQKTSINTALQMLKKLTNRAGKHPLCFFRWRDFFPDKWTSSVGSKEKQNMITLCIYLSKRKKQSYKTTQPPWKIGPWILDQKESIIYREMGRCLAVLSEKKKKYFAKQT